jgi:hypothetical protein
MNGLGHNIKSFSNQYFKEYEIQVNSKKLAFDDSSTEFVFHLLDKIVENFSAIGELLILSEQKELSYLRNSTYTLLRSCLYDCIICFWIFEIPDNNKSDNESIQEHITILRKDHIKFHVSFLRKMQSLGLLSKEERDWEIHILNTKYKHLITDEVKTDLVYKSDHFFSISEILTEKNKKNTPLVEAYKAYALLSKVEHTGEFTRLIMEPTYENKENPMDQYFESSINVIVATIKAVTNLYFKDESFISNFLKYKII